MKSENGSNISLLLTCVWDQQEKAIYVLRAKN